VVSDFAGEQARAGSGPLAGLVVIDVSTIIGGPMAALLLAEYGATVIKVEHPTLGDGARHMGYQSTGMWWKFLSHNKKIVTCNLSNPRGAELLRRACVKADVIIENFRPGTMEKWGLGYDVLSAINPKLVMLRVTGFGQDGPYSSRPGYGTLAEAMSGFAHLTGDSDGPPTLPGMPLADSMTGVMGAFACMTALWKRDGPMGTGRGQEIDLNLYGSLAYALGPYVVEHEQLGIDLVRHGNKLGNAPRNLHRCTDGDWVAYSAQSGSSMSAVVQFIGVQDDPRFADTATTLANADSLDEALGAWIAQRPRDEVMRILVEHGVPVGPVYAIPDLMADEHVRFRGDFVDIADGDSSVKMPRPPARFSDGDGLPGRSGGARGADNEDVYLGWLGLSSDEFVNLCADGVL
jgi:crotonobetainyl-CoA:carnitine CoA-transferase CaiB-like acyl-CoA transferase